MPRSSSDNAFDVRPAEILSDVEQGATARLREVIGETVTEVQCGRMPSLAPCRAGECDAMRRCDCYMVSG